MMKKRTLGWFLWGVAVGFLALPITVASGSVSTGHFWATMGGSQTGDWNHLLEGGGDGYSWPLPPPLAPQSLQPPPPMWKFYAWNQANPQTDAYGNQIPQVNQAGWLNQWWYDDPYNPERYKRIDLSFWYKILNPAMGPGSIDFTVNWSTPAYSALGRTTPPDQNSNPQDPAELWVGRTSVHMFPVGVGDMNPIYWTGSFDLRNPPFNIPYNPEWISVDLGGYNFLVSSQAEPGSIIHQCLPYDEVIPEPATLALLSLGVAGIGAYIRRRFDGAHRQRHAA